MCLAGVLVTSNRRIKPEASLVVGPLGHPDMNRNTVGNARNRKSVRRGFENRSPDGGAPGRKALAESAGHALVGVLRRRAAREAEDMQNG